MEVQKDLDARISQDSMHLMAQARAARAAYIGRLLISAWNAVVRGIRFAATSGLLLLRRKSKALTRATVR